jgi:drug/metabolite transporter (DMT)-like permease
VTTPLSSFAWVVCGSVVGSFGAAGLKAGAQRLQFTIPALLSNWQLIAGGMGYLLSTVFFVQGLKNGELSVLYPMVSVGYLWSTLWGKLFFGEQITRTKVGALGLILLGAAILVVSAG